MSLFVRAPAEYANATYKIDVSDSDTIWQIKIKAFEHIAIPPFRQSLFTLGDSNKELENDKRIRDYPQLRHVANDARLVLLKDKEATSAEPHKRAKGSRVKQKIKVVKARRFREHVSPILCFAGGRGLSKGVVGIPCTIKLFPITKEYQLIQCKDRVVFDVSVSRVGSASDDSDQSIASIMYDTDKDSAILATWIPEEAGFFSVTVKINGSTIANSPRVVTIFDHENSGKKVKTMLTDPKWLVEGVSVLSFWAGRDEYQREIFSEIGLEVILQLVNAEPQEQIKPLLGIVFEKLLEKDIAKSLILEKGGPDALVQLIEISNSVQSNTIIRFVSRAIASLSRVNTEILRDPELKKLPQFKSLIGLGSMELFRLLEKQLARQQDPEILRNITRAVANFSESKIYLPSLSDAGMFPHMLSSFEGCNDRATQRYALAAFANWANTEYPLQRKYFTDARVSQLLKTIDHPESQDSLVTEAIKVLANLAQSREFASSFSTNPNIDRVIKSLGSTDDLTAWEIKSALAILPDPANRESLRQTISHGFHQDVRFNIESLRLIGNILEFSANSTSLSIHQDAVAISNIVRFTKSIDENLQYEACRCLSLLTVYEKPRDLIVKAGGLTSLCSAINTATIQAVQFIVLALANMPLTVKGILLSLIGDAGVNKLVTLLKQDQNKNVQRGAAILLASLAGNEEFTSKKIVQEGGSTFLKNLIELVRRGKVNVQNEIDPNTVELIGVVGEGISGVVWKAKWNDQLVAVKKFDENSLSFNEEEFRSEVALMSVLRHENVVHCIGSSMQEENLFILLELFNRGSVSTVVHDLSNPLPIQRAVSLALDAAKGMKYLHSLGLIHRDLKSGNLLVTDDWHAKVADFGLSRMADKMMTRGVGTPIYTAPEALASSNYTFKADVYSFAFIMWELATRRIPYEDLAPFEAVRRACDENLRPPIPQNCLFESLIVQCWDRNPETRPDFATIVDALEEIANVVGSDSLKAYESGSEVEEEEAQYQYEKINTIIGRTLRGRAGDGSTFGSKKFASRPRSPFPMSTSSSSSSSTPASVLPVTSSSSPIVPAASFSSLPQPVPSSSSSSSSSGSTSPAISGTKAISRSSSRRLKQSSFDATLLKDDSQDPPPPTLTQQSFSNPLIQSHPPATSTTSSPALAPSPLTAGVSSLSISEGSSQPAATRSTSTSSASASASTAGEAPDNGICPTCNKEVLGQKLKAIGRTFHPDCFVCFHCKGRLQGSFCRHQDKPYCNEDYKKLFMPHCARCQQLLTSQYLNALNKSWHRECFVCTRCSGPMKAYYDVGGFPYCDNCCNRT